MDANEETDLTTEESPLKSDHKESPQTVPNSCTEVVAPLMADQGETEEIVIDENEKELLEIPLEPFTPEMSEKDEDILEDPQEILARDPDLEQPILAPKAEWEKFVVHAPSYSPNDFVVAELQERILTPLVSITEDIPLVPFSTEIPEMEEAILDNHPPEAVDKVLGFAKPEIEFPILAPSIVNEDDSFFPPIEPHKTKFVQPEIEQPILTEDEGENNIPIPVKVADISHMKYLVQPEIEEPILAQPEREKPILAPQRKPKVIKMADLTLPSQAYKCVQPEIEEPILAPQQKPEVINMADLILPSQPNKFVQPEIGEAILYPHVEPKVVEMGHLIRPPSPIASVTFVNHEQYATFDHDEQDEVDSEKFHLDNEKLDHKKLFELGLAEETDQSRFISPGPFVKLFKPQNFKLRGKHYNEFTEYYFYRTLNDMITKELELLFHNCKKNNVLEVKKILKGQDVMSFHDDLGTTPLHYAVLKKSRDVAQYLIDIGKKDLLTKTYKETTDFKGCTALHIAVVKGLPGIVNYMLDTWNGIIEEKVEFIHTQANGAFFKNKLKTSGLPLSLAAWAGERIIYDTLMSHGADLLAADSSTGDTVMHTLVQQSLVQPKAAIAMMKHVLESEATKKWWMRIFGKGTQRVGYVMTEDFTAAMQNSILRVRNCCNETPLGMAVSIQAKEAFQYLVSVSKVYRYPQWEFGPTTQEYYEMSEFDHALERDDRNCIVGMLVSDPGDENLDFFHTEPIKTLIDAKWKTYRWFFYIWALLHISFMSVFSYFGIALNLLVPPGENNSTSTSNSSCELAIFDGYSQNRFYANFAICAVVYASISLLLAFHNVILNFIQYFKHCHRCKHPFWDVILKLIGPYRICSVAFSILIFVWFSHEICGKENSTPLLSITLIVGWSLVLYFTHIFKSVGIFTTMIERMLKRDFLPFVFVFVIVNGAFSLAFQCLLNRAKVPEVNDTYLINVPGTFFFFFQYLGGLAEEDILSLVHYPVMSRILLAAFIIFCNIMLLNMLIAALSDTYNVFSIRKENLWLKNRTAAVLSIERLFPKSYRKWLAQKTYLKTNNRFSFLSCIRESQDDCTYMANK